MRLEYERQPLASDSNWREDIEYRRLNKITRAQAEKERLEVQQRTDRKFREKYNKKWEKIWRIYNIILYTDIGFCNLSVTEWCYSIKF